MKTGLDRLSEHSRLGKVVSFVYALMTHDYPSQANNKVFGPEDRSWAEFRAEVDAITLGTRGVARWRRFGDEVVRLGRSDL